MVVRREDAHRAARFSSDSIELAKGGQGRAQGLEPLLLAGAVLAIYAADAEAWFLSIGRVARGGRRHAWLSGGAGFCCAVVAGGRAGWRRGSLGGVVPVILAVRRGERRWRGGHYEASGFRSLSVDQCRRGREQPSGRGLVSVTVLVRRGRLGGKRGHID